MTRFARVHVLLTPDRNAQDVFSARDPLVDSLGLHRIGAVAGRGPAEDVLTGS